MELSELPQSNENGNKFDSKGLPSPVKPRETWTNQLDFILSLIGYCVGLGNFNDSGN